MPEWIGFLIVGLQGVMIALLYLCVRMFGEYTASNNLLHQSMINAMKSIARIQKDGGNLEPKEPKVEQPAPFTSEENVG